MSVSELEALHEQYHADGFAPVSVDLLDWASSTIHELRLDVDHLSEKLEDLERDGPQLAETLSDADNALGAYCYELLGTHNPTPLDLRDHPALQRLIDAVR